MAKKVAIFTFPLIIAYTTYTVIDLNQRYPLREPAKYHQTSRVLPTLPHPHGDVDYMYTRIPVSQPVDRPLDTFLAAFYATWTLRTEAMISRIFDIAPSHLHSRGPAYCNGLFPVLDRYPDSIIVQWETPKGVSKLFKDRGKTVLGGGVQELSAVMVESDDKRWEMEIGYACAQWMDGPESLGKAPMALHRFYMRFLLDSARRRLERELR